MHCIAVLKSKHCGEKIKTDIVVLTLRAIEQRSKSNLRINPKN